MKTNFNFLDKLINKDEVHNYETLLKIKSIIFQLEEKLFQRSYLEISILSRYLYEALSQFSYVEMQVILEEGDHHEHNSIENIFKKWNKLSETFPKPNIFGLGKAFGEEMNFHIEELADAEKIRYLSNGGLHLTDFNDNNEFTIGGKIVNGKFTFNQMNFNDSINLLSSVHKIIKMVFEIINLDVHARIKAENFNNFLYDNGKSSIDALRNKEEFMDLIGESCHFCYEEDKEGIINIPRTKFKFPYGPFLECDTCNAIVGPNLNLKQNKKKIEKIKCDNCNDEDAYYKLTSSYSKNSELYRRPKLQCNICKHIRDE